MRRQAMIYGGVAFLAVFFVGWSTGMGGSLLPNLLFSLAMGALAAGCYVLAVRLGQKGGR